MLNLAHIFVLLNRVGEALGLAEKILREAGELDDETLRLRAIAITSIAMARRRSPASAVVVALSVMEMLRGSRGGGDVQLASTFEPPQQLPQSENFLSFFEDRALEFHWVLASDLDDAGRRLDAMRETFADTDSRLVHVRLVALEGLFALAREDFGLAMSLLEQAAKRLASSAFACPLCRSARPRDAGDPACRSS
jgi:hypothetical protein